MTSPYRNPPITEAVIELRFAEQVQMGELEKVRDKFAENYPLPAQNMQGFGANLSAGEIQFNMSFNGFRLTGADGDEVAVVGPQMFTTSQLAPYCGWDKFFQRFVRDRNIWNRRIEKQAITRIGLRFINRIDIPAFEAEDVDVSKYLKVFASFPVDIAQKRQEYLVRFTSKIGPASDWDLTLAVAKVPSVLIDRQSYILDLDVAFNKELWKEDDLLALLDTGRKLKNQAFESCITDLSRELFNQ
jgi:uncharacterized protein (TIGR04255 family)